MPIIYSAIVPHSLILIPTIGKNNWDRLKLTLDSYRKIEEDLYSLQPDTIIIISPHGPIQSNVFSMNLSPKFNGNFQEFGDFSTSVNLEGDIGLAYKIREHMETSAPLTLISEEKLDYGSTVPLYILTKMLSKIKIIPIYYSGLDLAAHWEFGNRLQRECQYSKNRIAVIASGDLSHRIAKDSPAGYSPKGKKFDQKLIELLRKDKPQDILKIDHHLIMDAGECGLKSITLLMGLLEGIKYKTQILSYEYPFGIGYLVTKFEIR